MLTPNDPEQLSLFKKRHSLSHILAQAVLQLYPQAKLAIGPAIDNGFYYDFDLPVSLQNEDLLKIEKIMRKILAKDHDFVYEQVSYSAAQEKLKNQPYKLEILDNLNPDEPIGFYTNGDFQDLCRGPHVQNTKEIDPNSFTVHKLAGAYWKGDENRPMLQRVYGLAFHNQEELQKYQLYLEEIQKRDHRTLAKQLDLYSINDKVGAGLILWHPNGAIIRQTLEQYWQALHTQAEYQIVYTPHVGQDRLWKTSGHLYHFKENMFPPMSMDNQDYYVKPMNCPFHIMIYKSQQRSYRQLPMRLAELGSVYRYEKSGVLHGLLRVRGFTQDDAHIFCTPEQCSEQVLNVLEMTLDFLKVFGFSQIKAYLSTKPEKAIGSDLQWKQAIEALKQSLIQKNLDYQLDPGGGAFYGPKIDIKIEDSLKRQWQLSTIQFDFNLPNQFKLSYIDENNTKQTPMIIHRAIMGSIERFFGILIEHFAGQFPLWLACVQIKILSTEDSVVDYAWEKKKALHALGFRCVVDDSDKRLGAKIRQAQQEKIPYMLILGKQEKENNTLSYRHHSGVQEKDIPWQTWIDKLNLEIVHKTL